MRRVQPGTHASLPSWAGRASGPASDRVIAAGKRCQIDTEREIRVTENRFLPSCHPVTSARNRLAGQRVANGFPVAVSLSPVTVCHAKSTRQDALPGSAGEKLGWGRQCQRARKLIDHSLAGLGENKFALKYLVPGSRFPAEAFDFDAPGANRPSRGHPLKTMPASGPGPCLARFPGLALPGAGRG